MLVVFDFETTGFKNNHAVEIAAVILTLDNSIYTYHSRCKPSSPIEDGAAAVHGLSNMMVQDERPDTEVVEEFWNDIQDLYNPSLGSLILAGHNNNFDMRVLRKYIRIPEGTLTLCSMKLGRMYSPEAPNHKLVNLHEHLGCAGDYKAHSALDDCYMSFNILKHYADKAGLSYSSLADLQTKSIELKTVPFGKYKGTSFSMVPADYMRYMIGLSDLDADVAHNFRQELARRGL